MAEYLIQGETLKAIADVIREKVGNEKTLSVSDIKNAITEMTVNEQLLKRYTLKSFIVPEGTNAIPQYFFDNCQNLTTLTLPDTITRIETNAFYACYRLELRVLPTSLITIGARAFASCGSLSIAEIPQGVTSIDSLAFGGCTGITQITFKGTPSKIAALAFDMCANLTVINVPWAEGEVEWAPWGATNATINYNYKE